MTLRSPWLAIAHTRTSTTIKEFKQSWDVENTPSALVALVGRQRKSGILQQLLQGGDQCLPLEPHGQVYLWLDPSSMGMLYVDCELHGPECPSAVDGVGPPLRRTADWHGLTDGPYTRRRVANLITGRAISSLCDIICYFASDLGGTRAVASLLAAQIVEQPATDQPFECLPRVLVIVDTNSQRFDEQICENSMLEMMSDALRSREESRGDLDIKVRIRAHFNQLRILGVKTPNNVREHSRQIRTRILSLVRNSKAARQENGMQFNRGHTQAFAGKLLDHLCAGYQRRFSFVSSSRPLGFSTQDLRSHFEELWSLLPSKAWIWHLLCPLLSSAILFASYPPGSHRRLRPL